MTTPRERPRTRSRTPYWLRFSLTLLSLGGITCAFVLVVLPRRFVLQAGLVESGMTFPAAPPAFHPPVTGPVVTPPPPPPGEARVEIPIGPAEALWERVTPLIDDGRYEASFPVFEAYLREYPDDLDVWLEYAASLVLGGHPEKAAAIYRRLLAAEHDPEIMLELARLQRDAGDFTAALALYEQLVAGHPDDFELRLEFARALVWARRYSAARRLYRDLLLQNPDDYTIRLELAQLLYWGGDPLMALLVLRDRPGGVSESQEGADLRLELDSLLLAEMPTPLSILERARLAAADEDLARAERLYRRVLLSRSRDPTIWLEWTDFLQYHLMDLDAAREALLRLEKLRPLESEERLRLAQLYAWTGREQDARRVLEDLVQDEPRNVAAWALLGDVYQWEGSRLAARDAYEQALALAPDNPEALAGLDTLSAQTYRAIAASEDRSVGTRLLFFTDSDDFDRIDMLAEAGMVSRATAIVVRAGYRRVEGIEFAGAAGEDGGPFASLELARWWRLGTVRASLNAGIEQLDAFGSQPSFAARLDIPDASGTGLSLLYRHGPAYSQTITFESIQAGLLSDHVEASAYRPLGSNWSLAVNGMVGSLHAGGASSLRASVAAAAVHALSPVLTAGITTHLLTFADSAPRAGGRRLYWDPGLFWATGLRLEVATAQQSGWAVYARVTPGVALSDERDGSGPRWVAQLTSETGIRVENRRLLAAGDLSYLRGREGDYNSFGANLRFAIKY